MKILVTGGTGFLGSHAVAALHAAGHEVRLLVRSRARVAPALEPLGVEKVETQAETAGRGERRARARRLRRRVPRGGRVLSTRLVSPRLMLPLARAGDAVRRLVPQPLYGADAIFVAACEARCDDSRARAELGFSPRPFRETLADTIRSLVDAGRLPAEKAGPAAKAPPEGGRTAPP